jgi:hypothetical protein
MVNGECIRVSGKPFRMTGTNVYYGIANARYLIFITPVIVYL